MGHACVIFLCLVGMLRAGDSLSATLKQGDSRLEAQETWDNGLCMDSKVPKMGHILERHTLSSHGDVCRDNAGGFVCPLMDRGQMKRQICVRTASGKPPFCEMQVSQDEALLPCRAPRASEAWLAKEMQEYTISTSRAQTTNSNRWSTCVEQRGFTRGQWVSSKKAIPGAGCKFNLTSWIWQPTTALCRLTPLSAETFCEVAERAGSKNILLVGDSLMRLWTSQMTGLVKQALKCSLNISYFSSNQMVAADVSNLRAGLMQIRPDVIIVNWGAHYGKRNRDGLEGAYTNETKIMAAMVAQVLSDRSDRAPLLIYRSTAPGHPNCASVPNRPASSQELSTLWKLESAKPLHEQKSHQWQWDIFPKLNSIAIPLWSKIGGALPMDVEEIAKLRPDLHIDETAPPGGLGVVGPDCLHYRKLACPSGFVVMNTWWTSLLQNILDSKTTHV